MSDKIARLGIERDNDLMYFIKSGAVWAVPRKKPGEPKGKQRKIADIGAELDYSKYLYFVDGDGDVARKARNSGGSKRKATKVVPVAKAGKRKSTGIAEGASGKTVAQLEREIAECLGAKATAAPAGARKKRR